LFFEKTSRANKYGVEKHFSDLKFLKTSCSGRAIVIGYLKQNVKLIISVLSSQVLSCQSSHTDVNLIILYSHHKYYHASADTQM
jgi:hypothetical protein